MQNKLKFLLTLCLPLIFIVQLYGQRPIRVGTTTANFLEIGYGASGIALGDAAVSFTEDISASYWNPGGLAFLKKRQALFMLQPWLVKDVKTSFIAVGVPIKTIGTFALNIVHMGYGDMEVTTLQQQNGTGEIFDANEFAVTFNYARAITNWFGFGAGIKYVYSQIWHETGKALAFDFGVLIKTHFFSPSPDKSHGLKIGMSISNYGTKLKYDGIDLLNPIDIDPNEKGNFQYAPGQFRLNSWELPLIFRVGASITPLLINNHQIELSIDAIHPNNNSESINVGIQYALNVETFGKIFLRSGYKGIFMEDSQYGFTLGMGLNIDVFQNRKLIFNYAYRNIGVFGGFSCYELTLAF